MVPCECGVKLGLMDELSDEECNELDEAIDKALATVGANLEVLPGISSLEQDILGNDSARRLVRASESIQRLLGAPFVRPRGPGVPVRAASASDWRGSDLLNPIRLQAANFL